MTSQTVEKMDGTPLPSRYEKFEKSEKMPPIHKLRFFLQGAVGVGKTSFICSFPKIAVLDFEDKTSAVKKWGPGSEPFRVRTAADCEALLAQLVADGASDNRYFDMVAFDTVMTLRDQFREQVTAEYKKHTSLKNKAVGDITSFGSDGSGWDILNRAVRTQIDQLKAVGYGWIASSHILKTWKGKGDNIRLTWESVLNKGILTYLHSQCEYCAYLTRHRDTVQEHGPTRTIQGKSLPGLVTTTTKQVYSLTFLPPSPDQEERQHIPMLQTTYAIPEGQGFNVVDEAYTKAKKAWQVQQLP